MSQDYGPVALVSGGSRGIGAAIVRVNAIAPGPVGRDMTAIVPERTIANLTETIALRRFASSTEITDLVEFLLSDEAAEITGTVLDVHGGTSL